ncbi:hypothetical protein FQR65_LT12765 [Abscondita terminalis]|nr:hypothetical protein FQR65_LT12765 [Abscondita terminalis]
MNGGVPSKELNKELYDISDQLPSTRDLRNILNQLASNSNLLDNSNCIQHIMFLLGAGANWDTQNRHGKTLSYYLDKRLSDILGWLASDRGADPNVQNQAGKTLLHYVAERNDTEGIGFLLKAGADPNVKDQYKKTPSEYATKDECRQAIEGLGCSSNDKTTCTKLSDPDPDKDQGYYSDDSRENEGNSTTPDGSVDDCSNSSGDDNKTISTEPSDCDPEDEDSSCSSSDYLFLEDSLLAKLEIPLTTDEQAMAST